jgi:hypothetical protein
MRVKGSARERDAPRSLSRRKPEQGGMGGDSRDRDGIDPRNRADRRALAETSRRINDAPMADEQ